MNKHLYLIENGWWCHYNSNCWFEKSKDHLRVKNGVIIGFRPKEEGITLEEAYKILKTNRNMKSTTQQVTDYVYENYESFKGKELFITENEHCFQVLKHKDGSPLILSKKILEK